MFWAWAHGQLDTQLRLEPRFHDIQKLNEIALESARLPLTKVSMATFLEPSIQERYQLLRAGAALGRGCGPLVVSKDPWSLAEPKPLRLAIPGKNTTACKLAQMALGSHVCEWVELRYDQIMPAVLDGSAIDAGVIIHESRFVYRQLGLQCALDLGDWWERETGLPLPLGVMIAHRDLGDEVVAEVERCLRESIKLAQTLVEQPSDERSTSLWHYLRSNAIEMDDSVMRSHIELYVNEHSVDLGEEGRAAVEAFRRKAR